MSIVILFQMLKDFLWQSSTVSPNRSLKNLICAASISGGISLVYNLGFANCLTPTCWGWILAQRPIVRVLLSVLPVFTCFIYLRRFQLLHLCLHYMNIEVSELHKTANSAVETSAYVHSIGTILPTVVRTTELSLYCTTLRKPGVRDEVV